MLFPDYHFHTDFSSDCDEPIQAVIASAKEKDLSALCVTDHYDMDFPVRPEEPDMDFDLDLDSYYRIYHALSETTRNISRERKICLPTGIILRRCLPV